MCADVSETHELCSDLVHPVEIGDLTCLLKGPVLAGGVEQCRGHGRLMAAAQPDPSCIFNGASEISCRSVSFSQTSIESQGLLLTTVLVLQAQGK